MYNAKSIVNHHLLEIIFWPMADGSFKTILNSVERLKELGVYKRFGNGEKLTIACTNSEHSAMHGRFRDLEYLHKSLIGNDHAKGKHWKLSEETCKKRSEAMKGKTLSSETRKKISNAKKGTTHAGWNKGRHRVYHEDGTFHLEVADGNTL